MFQFIVFKGVKLLVGSHFVDGEECVIVGWLGSVDSGALGPLWSAPASVETLLCRSFRELLALSPTVFHPPPGQPFKLQQGDGESEQR